MSTERAISLLLALGSHGELAASLRADIAAEMGKLLETVEFARAVSVATADYLDEVGTQFGSVEEIAVAGRAYSQGLSRGCSAGILASTT